MFPPLEPYRDLHDPWHTRVAFYPSLSENDNTLRAGRRKRSINGRGKGRRFILSPFTLKRLGDMGIVVHERPKFTRQEKFDWCF